jgi:L-ribulose-5-phosphate 4-epimerase
MRATGLTVSSLGNVSVRETDTIWITPTRVVSWDLCPEAIVRLDLDGSQRGPGEPSREAAVHIEIYRRFSHVRAVVHTHSPWATAWSHTGRDLDMKSEEMLYHELARIPCAAFAPTGSQILARHAAEALREAPVVLLRHHGVIAMAATPTEALELCAVAEQQAHVQWLLALGAREKCDR